MPSSNSSYRRLARRLRCFRYPTNLAIRVADSVTGTQNAEQRAVVVHEAGHDEQGSARHDRRLDDTLTDTHRPSDRTDELADDDAQRNRWIDDGTGSGEVLVGREQPSGIAALTMAQPDEHVERQDQEEHDEGNGRRTAHPRRRGEGNEHRRTDEVDLSPQTAVGPPMPGVAAFLGLSARRRRRSAIVYVGDYIHIRLSVCLTHRLSHVVRSSAANTGSNHSIDRRVIGSTTSCT